MIGNAAYIALVVTATFGILGATSARATVDGGDRDTMHEGAVKRCSLDGINPAYHPEIFGNPATARAFGFVLDSRHVWHVVPNCH
jgi:hypothetical protein